MMVKQQSMKDQHDLLVFDPSLAMCGVPVVIKIYLLYRCFFLQKKWCVFVL